MGTTWGQMTTTQETTPSARSDFWAVLTTPSCWLQNYPYSGGWDLHLNRLMTTDRFTGITHHYAKIGGCLVWVANHPYASFKLEGHDVRPSRGTILRAKNKLVADDLAARESAK
jgi:hypothetical protein